jgi:hypothetical protein
LGRWKDDEERTNEWKGERGRTFGDSCSVEDDHFAMMILIAVASRSISRKWI